jgi:hypothetical protein
LKNGDESSLEIRGVMAMINAALWSSHGLLQMTVLARYLSRPRLITLVALAPGATRAQAWHSWRANFDTKVSMLTICRQHTDHASMVHITTQIEMNNGAAGELA